MSAARPARRRRKQAAMGKRGLEQVYGKLRAPTYNKRSTSQKRIERWLENKRKNLF